MKKWNYIFLILLLLANVTSIKATHIIGGAVSYECLGNGSYRITVAMYRDCSPGSTGFDDPASVAIYNSNNDLIQNLSIPFPGSTQLSSTINNPCYSPPSNICVEEAIYTTIVNNLPPIQGGYTISYQRCCRNNTILNLIDPGTVGATFTAHIPGTESVSSCNGNPVFKEFPPIFLCSGMPLNFDHSAIDPDGDLLVYEICDPYTGATTTAPMPSPAPPPPYSYVNWNPPYSGSYPMSSNPVLSINSQTGLLTGTPNTIGQWVVGVCVKEYRNGVLLSSTTRDFQFNVISCPGLVVASFPSQTLFCNGYNVSFQNNSYNSSSFLWDFGVPGITTDTSTLLTPSYTYPTSGIYTVSLIANPYTACADTAYSTFDVQPLLQPLLSTPNPSCLSGNVYNFSAGGSFSSTAIFNWTFPAATPSTSTQQNPTGIVFNNTGTFPVTLTVDENGCSKSVFANVEIVSDVVAEIEPQRVFCGGFTYDFTNFSQNASSYLWTFGDPVNSSASSTDFEPSYTYSDSGWYTVTLIAAGPHCSDTISETFSIYPLLKADFNCKKVQCFEANNFDFVAGGTFDQNANFLWDFGSDANIQSSTDSMVSGVQFNFPGFHTINLTIQENGCTSIKSVEVELQPKPVADLSLVENSGCVPLTVKFQDASVASTPLVYNWDFGDGSQSDKSNPEHIFLNPGSYDIKLFVHTVTGCIDSSSIAVPQLIAVYPLPDADFLVLPLEASIFEPVFNFTDESKDNVRSVYYFGDGNSSEQFDVEYIYSDTGDYIIKQIVYSTYGCADTASGVVRVVPEYRFYVPNAFTPDGDNLNDVFRPEIIGAKEYEMLIFNRWGELIFKTNDTEIGWDGRVKNGKIPAQMEVYSYLINLTNVFDKSFVFTGHVTLVR